jgi:hypothetical protein
VCAGVRTGTIDECGWPNVSAASANLSQQWIRRDTPLLVDFSNGLDPTTMYINLDKGCCEKYPLPDYSANIVSRHCSDCRVWWV